MALRRGMNLQIQHLQEQEHVRICGSYWGFLLYPYMWVGLHALGRLQNEEIVDKLSNHIYSAGQTFGKALPRPGLTVPAILLAIDLPGLWLFLYSLDADHEVAIHRSGNYFDIFGLMWQAWISLQPNLTYVDCVRHYLAIDLILTQTNQFKLWTTSGARPRRPN